MKKVTVTQDTEAPVERPVLATSIVEISHALTKLLTSGLTEHAIVVLVADSSGVGRPDVRAVLAGLKNLRKDYCKI